LSGDDRRERAQERCKERENEDEVQPKKLLLSIAEIRARNSSIPASSQPVCGHLRCGDIDVKVVNGSKRECKGRERGKGEKQPDLLQETLFSSLAGAQTRGGLLCIALSHKRCYRRIHRHCTENEKKGDRQVMVCVDGWMDGWMDAQRDR
jgi:hypothetical protein